MEQILPDRNISESDPLANVANNSSTLIFRTLQYIYIYIWYMCSQMEEYHLWALVLRFTQPGNVCIYILN